ncbi:hypothetical protein [Kordia sp.]|uniref:hypothetical protein n=1 Tax=Kordia sp. TaxID=1965332 RepID=UPI003D278D0A
MKQSRGIVSKKEQLAIHVTKIAKKCKNFTELHTKLVDQNIEPYYRYGKLTGVWYGNKKFRLSTLGVGKEHLKKLTKEQERLESLKKNKDKNINRELVR